MGDLFEAGNLESLPRLNGLHKNGGLNERLGGARVEPGEAAAETFHAELAAPQVIIVHVRDF